MPQRRMITSALWSDLDFVSLSLMQRLLWLALISNADDQGRLQGHPALVRSACFPAEDYSLDEIGANLDAIARLGWIVLYERCGKQYIQIAKWWRHQTMAWAQPSQHPAPEGWKDSLRYRIGDRVVTENWDNKPTADAQSTYSVRTGDSGERAAQGDNITEHNLTELKENITESAAPTSAPQPLPSLPHESDPVEPSTHKRHNLPLGKEPSDAVKTWLTVANSAGQKQTPTPIFVERIDARVTAETVPKWRAICEQWAAKGYRMRNVDGLLAVFADGWESGNGHSPPKGHVSQTVDIINQMIAEERAHGAA